MIELFAAIAIFAACIFVTWVIYAIVNAIWEHKVLKKRLAHPKFYGWIAELDEKIDVEARYRVNEIAPIKREIDRLIAEQPYFTAEEQVRMLGVLEEYREALADRQYELKRMEFESAKLRNRIREYNKEHNLESGWND
jgi:hypothetical protein